MVLTKTAHPTYAFGPFTEWINFAWSVHELSKTMLIKAYIT